MANSEKNTVASKLNNRAVLLIEKGDYKEAIDLLTKALTLDPSRTGLLFNRAEAYRLSGNFDAASRDLFSILQTSPGSDEVLHGLGLVAYDQDDFSKATDFYKKALDSNPSFAPAWNDLGVVEFRLSHYESARQNFEKAVALAQDFSDAWFNLADTYDELGMADKRAYALAQLRRAQLKNGEKADSEEDA